MKRVLVLLAFVLTACGGASVASGPPEIDYGRDICIECGMIIDDPRFAASYRLPDGTEKGFDDLGGLIIQGRESDELADAEVWVSDFEDQVFIEADDAFYVPTLGVTSPMGHGILAFSEKARADAMAAELGGEVISWDLVVELPVIEGLVGQHHELDEKTS
jgi:copper chaperone NosL